MSAGGHRDSVTVMVAQKTLVIAAERRPSVSTAAAFISRTGLGACPWACGSRRLLPVGSRSEAACRRSDPAPASRSGAARGRIASVPTDVRSLSATFSEPGAEIASRRFRRCSAAEIDFVIANVENSASVSASGVHCDAISSTRRLRRLQSHLDKKKSGLGSAAGLLRCGALPAWRPVRGSYVGRTAAATGGVIT